MAPWGSGTFAATDSSLAISIVSDRPTHVRGLHGSCVSCGMACLAILVLSHAASLALQPNECTGGSSRRQCKTSLAAPNGLAQQSLVRASLQDCGAHGWERLS